MNQYYLFFNIISSNNKITNLLLLEPNWWKTESGHPLKNATAVLQFKSNTFFTLFYHARKFYEFYSWYKS